MPGDVDVHVTSRDVHVDDSPARGGLREEVTHSQVPSPRSLTIRHMSRRAKRGRVGVSESVSVHEFVFEGGLRERGRDAWSGVKLCVVRGQPGG